MLPIGVPEWVSELIMPVSMGIMAIIFIWNASEKWWGRSIALACVAGAFAVGLVPADYTHFLWPLALLGLTAALLALFTTFTGGSGVTIIALGGLVYPILRKDGYSEGFSLGLVTAAGSLGLLFPPSLPVILYSVVASSRGASVPADQLFIAGLLPGLLLVVLTAGYGIIVGRHVEREKITFSWREVA